MKKIIKLLSELSLKETARTYKINKTKIVEILIKMANEKEDLETVILITHLLVILFDTCINKIMILIDLFFSLFEKLLNWKINKNSQFLFIDEPEKCCKVLFDHLYLTFPFHFVKYIQKNFSEDPKNIFKIENLCLGVSLHSSLIFPHPEKELSPERLKMKDGRYKIPTPLYLYKKELSKSSLFSSENKSSEKNEKNDFFEIESTKNISPEEEIEKKILDLHSLISNNNNTSNSVLDNQSISTCIDVQLLRSKIFVLQNEILLLKFNNLKTLQHLSSQHNSFIQHYENQLSFHDLEVSLQRKKEKIKYLKKSKSDLEERFKGYQSSQQDTFEKLNEKFLQLYESTKLKEKQSSPTVDNEKEILRRKLNKRDGQ